MEKSSLIPFLLEGLDILFIGLNPAKGSSRNRHYFSVNQAFWNQLYRAGLITNYVDKMYADVIVFGSNDINYTYWSFGITDLITEIAESDSRKIKPTVQDCIRLEKMIGQYEPKTAVLLHGTVVKSFFRYLNRPIPPTNAGYLGRILPDCTTDFFTIAFPHGNTIRSDEKISKYVELKNHLINGEAPAVKNTELKKIKDMKDKPDQPTQSKGDKMLSENTVGKAKEISNHLQEYCSNHPNEEYKPKDVLPYLVEKGIFNKVDSRNGRDLRQVFRDVDAAGRLSELIPQVYPERKKVNTYWFIKAVQ